MRPEELIQLRKEIYHSQAEFAQLLSELRGVQVPQRTLEGWERGRGTRPAPIYLTDLAAIRQATTPKGAKCEQCEDDAVIRKDHLDLCAECATPHNGSAEWAMRQAG